MFWPFWSHLLVWKIFDRIWVSVELIEEKLKKSFHCWFHWKKIEKNFHCWFHWKKIEKNFHCWFHWKKIDPPFWHAVFHWGGPLFWKALLRGHYFRALIFRKSVNHYWKFLGGHLLAPSHWKTPLHFPSPPLLISLKKIRKKILLLIHWKNILYHFTAYFRNGKKVSFYRIFQERKKKMSKKNSQNGGDSGIWFFFTPWNMRKKKNTHYTKKPFQVKTQTKCPFQRKNIIFWGKIFF